jgi:hypothetical protein
MIERVLSSLILIFIITSVSPVIGGNLGGPVHISIITDRIDLGGPVLISIITDRIDGTSKPSVL